MERCVSLVFVWCLIIMLVEIAVGLIELQEVTKVSRKKCLLQPKTQCIVKTSPLLPLLRTSAVQVIWTVQLHHSSGSLCLTKTIAFPCAHLPHAALFRRAPMICYYLFRSLCLPEESGKKVTWYPTWGFNQNVSWRTRKMAFTVIEFWEP